MPISQHYRLIFQFSIKKSQQLITILQSLSYVCVKTILRPTCNNFGVREEKDFLLIVQMSRARKEISSYEEILKLVLALHMAHVSSEWKIISNHPRLS